MNLEPIKRIARRARDAGKTQGVDLLSFAVVVDLDGDDDRVELLYDVPEPAADTPAPLDTSEQDQFKELEERFREQAHADRVEEARESLRAMLRDNRGRGLFSDEGEA